MIPGRGGRICLAFLLDLALGEPPERWHPVCWMGKAVAVAERPFTSREAPEALKRAAGAAVAGTLPLATFLATRRLIRFLPRPLAMALEVTALWTALATRSLYVSARAVERGLEAGLESGREQVAGMVGRDTANLDVAGVARAAVESVAENANDGVVAPLFFAFAGGAPLALAYKMVNTLDSMVGYRNRRYQDFGWASARLDDIAGFLPARLTAAAVVTAGYTVGADGRAAWRVWRRDSGGHASPNAGVCEGAFAGALGVRLGGDDRYGGNRRERAVIGAGLREPRPDDIARAAKLMLAAALAVLAAGMSLLKAGRGLKRALAPGRRR